MKLGDQRCTPPEVWQLAARAVGKEPPLAFDTDPCSNPHTSVRATRRYFGTGGPDDNGLDNPWHGDVFVNPPFSNILPWVRWGWIHECQPTCRSITFLTPAERTARWAWKLEGYGAPCAAPRRRVHFPNPLLERDTPNPNGSFFLWLMTQDPVLELRWIATMKEAGWHVMKSV